jgi:uncharacterized protein (TIGR03066 family)
MSRLAISTFTLLLFPLLGCGDTADKIIGVWSIVKVGDKKVPDDEPATMQFTKDGKHIVKIKSDGKETTSEGTYSIKDDKITATGKGADGVEKSSIITIKHIVGDAMVLVKDGIDIELKRK